MWRRKKEENNGPNSPHPPLPPATVEPERYKGRPLLVILENYVLDCIGELPAERQPGMAAIVRQAFGSSDDWKAAVRQALQLPDTLDAGFRRLWDQNMRVSAESGAELHPVQFAKMVVDANFADLIGPPLPDKPKAS